MRKLIISRLWKFLGSARIDRDPSARGPNSERPFIHATIFPLASAFATNSTSGCLPGYFFPSRAISQSLYVARGSFIRW